MMESIPILWHIVKTSYLLGSIRLNLHCSYNGLWKFRAFHSMYVAGMVSKSQSQVEEEEEDDKRVQDARSSPTVPWITSFRKHV